MSGHRHGHSRKRGKRTYYTPDAVADFARREWDKMSGGNVRDSFKGDFMTGNPPFAVNENSKEET